MKEKEKKEYWNDGRVEDSGFAVPSPLRERVRERGVYHSRITNNE
jgi:hypothetical protein